MFVTITEGPNSTATWWLIGNASKHEMRAINDEYPKILSLLYETKPLLQDFNKFRLGILGWVGAGITALLFGGLSGKHGLNLPMYIGAIPMAIWLIMFVSYAIGMRVVPQINTRLKAEREALKKSGRLINLDSPGLKSLMTAVQDNRDLLEWHKKELDHFLLSPTKRRAEELIDEEKLSREKITDISTDIFLRYLQELRKLEAQRQVANQEAEHLTHLLDDGQ